MPLKSLCLVLNIYPASRRHSSHPIQSNLRNSLYLSTIQYGYNRRQDWWHGIKFLQAMPKVHTIKPVFSLDAQYSTLRVSLMPQHAYPTLDTRRHLRYDFWRPTVFTTWFTSASLTEKGHFWWHRASQHLITLIYRSNYWHNDTHANGVILFIVYSATGLTTWFSAFVRPAPCQDLYNTRKSLELPTVWQLSFDSNIAYTLLSRTRLF